MRLRTNVAKAVKLTAGVWPPNNLNTQTLQRDSPQIYFREFREMPTRFFSHCFINFYGSFCTLWLLLCWNNLNQFCLSTRHPANETLQQQTPLQQQRKTPWQLVLQLDCARHFSDMAFEGINSWLSLVKMLFFQLSYQCGEIWPSELCGRRGSHQNKLQAAAFVKEVLLVVVTGLCAILPQSLSLSHTLLLLFTQHWRLQLLLYARKSRTGCKWDRIKNYTYRLTHKIAEYIPRKRDLNLCFDLLPLRFNKGRINRGKNVIILPAPALWHGRSQSIIEWVEGPRPSRSPSSNSQPFLS